MDFMKKRKLNALLNGLGNRSSYPTASSPTQDTATHDLDDAPKTPPSHRNSTVTTDSTSSTIRTPASDSMAMRPSYSSLPKSIPPGDLELLTKRRRLGFPDSTPSKDSNPTIPQGGQGQTTISNIVLKKWSGNNTTNNPNKEKSAIFKPKYCPGDREELLKRLASFQELTDWTPKPDPVNEVEWAKRGWICQGKERVRCTLCNKELVVKLNRKEVDGKEVPVLVPSEIEDALVARDFLPYEFNLRLPEKLDIDTVLDQLPPNFFTVPPPPAQTTTASTTTSANPPPTKPNRVALALAILGWQGLSNARIGPVPNTSSCHTCLRRLGLWMFKSKEVDPETGTVITPAPMDHLDPLREHRFFCPWKNGEAQRINPVGSARRRPGAGEEEEDAPGWEMLLQILKNEAYLRGRETPSKGTPASRSGKKAAGTPRRSPGGTEAGDDGDEEEDEKAQNAKDKERWARLRRVKSLLSTKGADKLRKSMTRSRPGTSESTAQGGGDAPQGGEGTPSGADSRGK
ncbi:hypothetical protein VP1G_00519 [Cytospora mali]|uniref:mRNA export factor rsm1 n=1 Tax=Cytospora mali TaxID=578113 RepID=A0A194UMZ6_CYTMA|nr:hypothetical protein VP1G_00519 [Valsa mali var. pyri (nom. inval.)]